MEKKYELIETDCDGCYRIKSLKDFNLVTGEVVRKGDLGGYVAGKHNLSHEGNCWIEYYARAYDNSMVKDNAVLKNFSMARNNSTVSGNAVMKDFSRTWGNSTISGNAVMKDYSCAQGDSIISGNAILQAFQRIQYGTVTTDLLGTKDWAGVLYAELGVTPKNNKVILYKKVWKTDNPDVFKSDYDENFLYKIGKTVVAENVDEDIFNICARGLHFTSLEFLNDYDGNTILKCEVEVNDIITILNSQVRARKCRVLRVYKEE